MADTQEFSRKVNRQPYDKYFSISSLDVSGESNMETFKPYKDYQIKEQTMKACMVYARAYVETAMNRLADADPDFLRNNDISQRELELQLTNNICQEAQIIRNAAFVKTQADIVERKYVKEDIRRLINGGQRFHPYF
jgi:hypothetical protein